VTVIKKKVNLALTKQIKAPGGIGVSMAIMRANKAVEGMRERLLETVDGHIADAEAAVTAIDGTQENLQALYDAADQLVAIAGACELPAVVEAALGLCDLVDWLQQRGQIEQRALEVHVAAFRLLRHATQPAARDPVLAGLKKVRERYLGPQDPPPMPEPTKETKH
jgi:hypothetical protein